MVYYSKYDLFLGTVVVGLPSVAVILLMVSIPNVIIRVACLCLITFLYWVFFGTKYTIKDNILKAQTGPFKYKINIHTITKIKNTRNPLSSPASSLDRLEIFSTDRYLIISPKDQESFLSSILEINPEVIIKRDA